jgi:type II secretory pathway pseudopilin PulG
MIIKKLLSFRQKGVMFGIECRALKKQFGELFLASMQSVAPKALHGSRSNTINRLNFKAGVMFGIDARVTMAVTAIAALIVGINQFNGLDKADTEKANLELRTIKNSVLDYYKDKYTLVTDIDTLMTQNYLSLVSGFNMDPWGNTYEITSFTRNESFNGYQMPVNYVVVYSKGKNGTRDFTVPSNYTNWVSLEATSDDVIYKFSSKDIDQEVATIEQNQLSIIKVLLENYIREKQQELETFCAIASNQREFDCDIDQNKIYDEGEHLENNFMLKEKDEAKGKYYITTNGTHGTDNEFKSGYIKADHVEHNMYTFMDVIGGYAGYVQSPRGMVLHFDSNKYNTKQAPYYADVWYANEVTVF